MKGVIGKGNWLLISIYMFALSNSPKGAHLKCVIVSLRVEQRGNLGVSWPHSSKLHILVRCRSNQQVEWYSFPPVMFYFVLALKMVTRANNRSSLINRGKIKQLSERMIFNQVSTNVVSEVLEVLSTRTSLPLLALTNTVQVFCQWKIYCKAVNFLSPLFTRPLMVGWGAISIWEWMPLSLFTDITCTRKPTHIFKDLQRRASCAPA